MKESAVAKDFVDNKAVNHIHEQSPLLKSQPPGQGSLLLTTPPERIAVFRALNGLGDILCTVPAFRSLRVAFPQAEIVLVGLASIKPLIKRFNRYIDRLIEFPGYPGLPEQPIQLSQIPAFIQHAHNEQFDLAIQMHGNGVITNPLTVMLGARCNAGFFLPEQYCPDENCFLPYISDESEVLRYLRLLEFLGVASQGTELEFPIYEEDLQALREINAIKELSGQKYVCIHPGASTLSRCWQPEGFAAVADAIASLGLHIVLTGSASEVPLTQTVASLMKASSLNMAGRTSLGALAALLQQANLLICNDTGVSHLAAALQLKSVAIFTNSDPLRWAPLNRDRHRIVCSATGVNIETVIAQAKDLLLKDNVCTI
ncbi:MAG TPA: glycosyltransferase family 9 protein [Leptolyngbyaceae cyanobacterium]